LIHRPRSADETQAYDFVNASGWHADGPRPRLFPRVNGAMGLHYLKFGFFLTDLSRGGGGSLQVVRGSHRRPELDDRGPNFRIEDYARDLVTLDCEAGTVVAFHQAQWHAAPPNRSDTIRQNVYISYCPTWMRPLDREPLRPGDGPGLSAEERWLLGEPRESMRWWLPSAEDKTRLSRYERRTPAAKAPGA
jgi:ectoine hydroxylase-related dioxygenase (phytanoyl-CoA dioxygenase family)